MAAVRAPKCTMHYCVGCCVLCSNLRFEMHLPFKGTDDALQIWTQSKGFACAGRCEFVHQSAPCTAVKAAAYCTIAVDSKGICLPKAQTTLFNHGRNRKYSVEMFAVYCVQASERNDCAARSRAERHASARARVPCYRGEIFAPPRSGRSTMTLNGTIAVLSFR